MTRSIVRPALGVESWTAEAETAAGGLASQLQHGLDTSDADAYDAWFGSDVLWGNPRGGTLAGFVELNAIHHELMARAIAPESRFEVLAVLAPAPGVAVAHIRREALAHGGFSETAMYVLVQRGDAWWLAAAQNTPVTVEDAT